LSVNTGLDFSSRIELLAGDMVRRLPEFRHIDLDRVAIGFCQTRKAVRHGMYASLTPLRFVGGRRDAVRRGRRWGLQSLWIGGREMLYVLNFYLPRFLDLDFPQKLSTIAHELWHISPRFDGDLRRFQGRCWAHSGSQKRFDQHARSLAVRWLSESPSVEVYEFLQHDYRSLVRQYGSIFGRRIPAPKLVPLGDRG
jgi:predicted metallopeptidase